MANRPELLAPAGSLESLKAAISAGADAVYFGATAFNARNRAENFSPEQLKEAIDLCRLHGVKTNITVNTQILEKEIPEALKLVGDLLEMGADAFIVADLGLASRIKAEYPGAVLHASTQASGQNLVSAKALAGIGFSRMVAPRELSMEDMAILCRESPIETEVFVHGALCVSVSGQCLMSAMIGGRSGNRGECAQPCRLPYRCHPSYPLSLKDSCLAGHLADLLEMGISSLKIEGRMKSPDYVYGVTHIYRSLIDERRNATTDEIRKLSELFSRSGFTDGYYVRKTGTDMLGIRTDEQKKITLTLEGKVPEIQKVPVRLNADFSAEKAMLRAECTVLGKNYTAAAVNDAGTTDGMKEIPEDRLRDALSKSGGTPFCIEMAEILTGNGARVPLSAVNSLRRTVLDNLKETIIHPEPVLKAKPVFEPECRTVPARKTAEFLFSKNVTKKSLEYFDIVFVPVEEYVRMEHPHEKIGIALPPVVFDTEMKKVLDLVARAKEKECRYLLAKSLWQAEKWKDDFSVTGDFRLNVWNASSVRVLRQRNVRNIIASPETDLGKASRMGSGISSVAYGKLPMMTMQKCVIRELVNLPYGNCSYCDGHDFTVLPDRTGAEFKVCRAFGHRNVILNSVPVWMLDRADDYEKSNIGMHFLFSDETGERVDEVIDRAARKMPCDGKFRRI